MTGKELGNFLINSGLFTRSTTNYVVWDGYHIPSDFLCHETDHIYVCSIILEYYTDSANKRDISVSISIRDPYGSRTTYTELLSKLETSKIIHIFNKCFIDYPKIVLQESDRDWHKSRKLKWSELLSKYQSFRREYTIDQIFI